MNSTCMAALTDPCACVCTAPPRVKNERAAANSLLLSCHSPSRSSLSSSPRPLSHTPALTAKVWNRLQIGPQNQRLWHVVKPAWNTLHSGPKKGKEGKEEGPLSISPLLAAVGVARCFSFPALIPTFSLLTPPHTMDTYIHS